jgi:hypothetical protein
MGPERKVKGQLYSDIGLVQAQMQVSVQVEVEVETAMAVEVGVVQMGAEVEDSIAVHQAYPRLRRRTTPVYFLAQGHHIRLHIHIHIPTRTRIHGRNRLEWQAVAYLPRPIPVATLVPEITLAGQLPSKLRAYHQIQRARTILSVYRGLYC